MPSVSQKQVIAMRIAAAGKSNIGIPQKVGKDFVAADKGMNKNYLMKLPYKKTNRVNSLAKVIKHG
jgi:hypothetical protein